MKKAEVKFENITKKFNETVAVDNVSCIFEAGTLTTLLGPSGCGKTTSLRIIAGLERATSGKILVDNEDVTILPATDRDVSMVFQSYALFPHMSVIENVSYGLKMINVNKEEYTEKALETLKLVNLDGYENRMPSELSGGQQQRVAVARAIVLKPKVLLFDEPLSNLDAKLRRQVREDIREIQQKLGVTTIYVTHDQEEALAISDKVIVMNKAVIAQQGSPKDLYNFPKNKFVANFIGDANDVSAEIINKQSNTYELRLAEMSVKIENNQDLKDKVTLALRPEKIKIKRDNNNNCIHATIKNASFVGSSYQYILNSKIGNLYVVTGDTNDVFNVGEEVFLSIDKKDIKILNE
ncbi:ABC transporter ATP-binding protein [Candidatus Pelagibacter sp.]|nr:ABC transporter ATP-binding protein [bacterium]MDB2679111.1 ABC transporter ATP-binding protein [Candidatus Pelagibacter bacterium]MDB3970536.1 ABC transporter ATP-binding protein [Candidatus Pelagibacter sp.]MDB3974967.1 ABC transporter ATP-binding protein [Candidatus Pelagibacter sp.]MDB9765164.1 ABC transporter ATP-binding protein [Candidatus Pelagibacter sp.]